MSMDAVGGSRNTEGLQNSQNVESSSKPQTKTEATDEKIAGMQINFSRDLFTGQPLTKRTSMTLGDFMSELAGKTSGVALTGNGSLQASQGANPGGAKTIAPRQLDELCKHQAEYLEALHNKDFSKHSESELRSLIRNNDEVLKQHQGAIEQRALKLRDNVGKHEQQYGRLDAKRNEPPTKDEKLAIDIALTQLEAYQNAMTVLNRLNGRR